jgi:hypothetical protein
MPDPEKAVVTITVGTGEPGSVSRARSWPLRPDVAEAFAQAITERWGTPVESLMPVPPERPAGLVVLNPDAADDG